MSGVDIGICGIAGGMISGIITAATVDPRIVAILDNSHKDLGEKPPRPDVKP